MILKDASITVDGVDLSDRCLAVAVPDQVAQVEDTAMGANAKTYDQDISDPKITATFKQDYAAGSVHETLQSVKDGEVPVTVVVKPTSAAASATNPSFTMQGILPAYQAIGGSRGDLVTVDAEFQNADDSGIVVGP